MIDTRLKKLADLLVNYSVEIQPGEWVLIRGNHIAEPLISEVNRAVLEAGGHPTIQMSSDDLSRTHFQYSSDEQLLYFRVNLLA